MSKINLVEVLKLQPLTEEEKSRRHILGRLAGPIATCSDPTRNDRLYNRPLWEKALRSDLFLEKIQNKGLFMELGHPNYEEINLEKACACMPEVPKFVGDDLYAYVDILDTPTGKILKTLCDYGFTPGISSRGSGDVDMDNNVDPETFFLETFDIVNVPAVKKARMSITESLNNNKKSLRKALTEAYESVDGDAKIMMKEKLDELDIQLENLSEEVINEEDIAIKLPTEDEVDFDTPMTAEEKEYLGEALTEDVEDDVEVEEVIEEPEAEVEAEEVEAEAEEVEAEAEEVEAEAEENAEEETVENEVTTVADFIAELDDFDQELEIGFAPVVIGEDEYVVDGIEYNEAEDGKLLINLILADNENESDDIESVEDEEVEVAEDAEDDAAEDNGADDEVLESLKESIRTQNELAKQVKTLTEANAVNNVEVKKLSEELTKYKDSFARTSEIASNSKAKITEAEKTISVLKEQLEKANQKITSLQNENTNSAKLTESMNSQNQKVASLTEQLNKVSAESAEAVKKLTEQVNKYKKGYEDRTNIAKQYRDKFNQVLTRYIENKADMLGIKSADITNRLSESYTLNDVDNVCVQIIREGSKKSRIYDESSRQLAESRTSKTITLKQNPYDKENGYEIDDSLLALIK